MRSRLGETSCLVNHSNWFFETAQLDEFVCPIGALHEEKVFGTYLCAGDLVAGFQAVNTILGEISVRPFHPEEFLLSVSGLKNLSEVELENLSDWKVLAPIGDWYYCWFDPFDPACLKAAFFSFCPGRHDALIEIEEREQHTQEQAGGDAGGPASLCVHLGNHVDCPC